MPAQFRGRIHERIAYNAAMAPAEVICFSCRLFQPKTASCAFCGSTMLVSPTDSCLNERAPAVNEWPAPKEEVVLSLGGAMGMVGMGVGISALTDSVVAGFAAGLPFILSTYFIRDKRRQHREARAHNRLSEVPAYQPELKVDRSPLRGTVMSQQSVRQPMWARGFGPDEAQLHHETLRQTEGHLCLRALAGLTSLLLKTDEDLVQVYDLDSCLVESQDESWLTVRQKGYLERFGMPYRFDGQVCRLSIRSGDKICVWADEIVTHDVAATYRSMGGCVSLGRVERPVLIEVLSNKPCTKGRARNRARSSLSHEAFRPARRSRAPEPGRL
jgi:hypothetical protein